MSQDYIESDTLLIRDFNAGKGAAFEAIYNKYFPTIYRFCFSLLERSEDAEDITQETFVKLFQLSNKVHSAPNVRAFLYITSRNACMDYFRHEKKKKEATRAIMRNLPPLNSEQINDELDSMYFEAVRNAMQRLPHREKEVLEKLCMEDIDSRTAAQQMDIKLEALYVLRSRAVSRLKKIIFAPNLEEGVLLFFVICYWM